MIHVQYTVAELCQITGRFRRVYVPLAGGWIQADRRVFDFYLRHLNNGTKLFVEELHEDGIGNVARVYT